MHLQQLRITRTWLQIAILATHIDFIVYVVIWANICGFLWYVYFWVDKCVGGVICRSIRVCYCNIWACPKLFLWTTTNSARSVFTLSYVYYEYICTKCYNRINFRCVWLKNIRKIYLPQLFPAMYLHCITHCWQVKPFGSWYCISKIRLPGLTWYL